LVARPKSAPGQLAGSAAAASVRSFAICAYVSAAVARAVGGSSIARVSVSLSGTPPNSPASQ